MRYQSRNFGKVDWPWWHDALIIIPALVILCGIVWIGEKVTG